MIDRIIAGLQIIREVEPDNPWISAEHDEIYVGEDVHKYTEEQISQLQEWGFNFDEGISSFRLFV